MDSALPLVVASVKGILLWPGVRGRHPRIPWKAHIFVLGLPIVLRPTTKHWHDPRRTQHQLVRPWTFEQGCSCCEEGTANCGPWASRQMQSLMPSSAGSPCARPPTPCLARNRRRTAGTGPFLGVAVAFSFSQGAIELFYCREDYKGLAGP